jgi:two-component system nitrate/nitrite response regulator NarL
MHRDTMRLYVDRRWGWDDRWRRERFGEKFDAAAMIRQGIAGILRKHCSPAALAQSIRDVSGGKDYFEPGYLRSVLAGIAAPSPDYQRKKLTDRERQVLQYVFEGLANKEIADRLHASESAVKATLQQLFSKTGVRTRSQLVRAALENYKDQL